MPRDRWLDPICAADVRAGDVIVYGSIPWAILAVAPIGDPLDRPRKLRMSTAAGDITLSSDDVVRRMPAPDVPGAQTLATAISRMLANPQTRPDHLLILADALRELADTLCTMAAERVA